MVNDNVQDDNLDANARTLESYEERVDAYIAGTPQTVSGAVKAWLDTAMGLIRPDGRILEIGSAHGRDAAYMESKGFTVERTDAVQAFIRLLREQGHDARLLNALKDEFGGPYAMVIANAVLLHFSPEETKQFLKSARKSLSPSGILAFTVKRGDGDAWSDEKLDAPRHFYYWQPDELQDFLKVSGFKVVSLHTETGKTDWLQVIVRK